MTYLVLPYGLTYQLPGTIYYAVAHIDAASYLVAYDVPGTRCWYAVSHGPCHFPTEHTHRQFGTHPSV